jgi:hypothetical protein
MIDWLAAGIAVTSYFFGSLSNSTETAIGTMLVRRKFFFMLYLQD